MYDVDSSRPRIWNTPTHVDIKDDQGIWRTWELQSIVNIDGSYWKLVDYYLDVTNTAMGTFVSGNCTITKPLKLLKPPPCKLTRVYQVNKVWALERKSHITMLHENSGVGPDWTR